MKRVIVLHPKQMEDDDVKALAARIGGLYQTTFDTEPCEIVTARDEFLAFEKKHGKPVNWERWSRHLTGTAQTFGTEPTFHVLVVAPDAIVGKATAQTVREALKKGRTVLRLTPDNTLVKASKVTDLDPDNFTRGWVVS